MSLSHFLHPLFSRRRWLRLFPPSVCCFSSSGSVFFSLRVPSPHPQKCSASYDYRGTMRCRRMAAPAPSLHPRATRSSGQCSGRPAERQQLREASGIMMQCPIAHIRCGLGWRDWCVHGGLVFQAVKPAASSLVQRAALSDYNADRRRQGRAERNSHACCRFRRRAGWTAAMHGARRSVPPAMQMHGRWNRCRRRSPRRIGDRRLTIPPAASAMCVIDVGARLVAVCSSLRATCPIVCSSSAWWLWVTSRRSPRSAETEWARPARARAAGKAGQFVDRRSISLLPLDVDPRGIAALSRGQCIGCGRVVG